MPRSLWTPALALLITFFSPAAITAPAAIDGVLSPAWLERDGEREALSPGIEVRPGDTLVTGAGGTVHMERNDGSSVHVGEHSRFEINHHDPDSDALYVRMAEGRMRYAGPVGGVTRPMYLDAGLLRLEFDSGEVLAEVRDNVGDVLLVAGEFRMSAPGLEPTRYSDPASWYRVHNGDLDSGTLAPESAGRQSGAMTLADARGVMEQGSRWVANLLSLREPANARRLAETLQAQGYPARVEQHRDSRGTWHRLLIAPFRSEADARAVGGALAREHGTGDPWIHRL